MCVRICSTGMGLLESKICGRVIYLPLVKESYSDASEMYLYEVIYICSNWLVFDQRASIACSVQKA